MMLTKKEQRLRRSRQTRIRIATQGVARLTVNRTNPHIYADRHLRRRHRRCCATASDAPKPKLRAGTRRLPARAATSLPPRYRQAHR